VIRNRWIRAGLALICVALGCFALMGSLARAIVGVDPERAYRLAPGNGAIAAAHAQAAFAMRPTADPKSPATQIALKALRDDATAVDAWIVLGFQAQLSGDKPRSDRLFAHASALSRRELRPQFWAIEEAVSRGDIDDALRHYDIALRTSSEAPGMLYPTLTAALAEPRIRMPLLKILASDPIWQESFINYAATSNLSPEGAVALFREGQRFDLPVSNDLKAVLVDQLLAKNAFDEAWSYYESFRPGVSRLRSRDPHFTLLAKTRSRFDWSTGTDPGLSASILDNGEHGLVDFALGPGVGGAVIEQTQLLPAGRYTLSGQLTGVDQPERTAPFWLLTCTDGRELGRVEILPPAQRSGRFAGVLNVPQGCPVQKLTLMARATDDVAGISGQVHTVVLAPAGL